MYGFQSGSPTESFDCLVRHISESETVIICLMPDVVNQSSRAECVSMLATALEF